MTFDEAGVAALHEKLNEALANEQPHIIVEICSDGGEVSCLFAMIDHLENAKRALKIVTYASGKAFSSGGILLSCGSPGLRFAGPNSMIMLHQLSAKTGGTAMGIAADSKEYARQMKQLSRILGKNTGQGSKYFEDYFASSGDTDVYLTPRDAKKMGLIDRIGTPLHHVSFEVQHRLV